MKHFSNHWLVAVSQAGQLDTAFENVESKGWKPYIAKISESYIQKGRHVSNLLPLFGRYFFVQLRCLSEPSLLQQVKSNFVNVIPLDDSWKSLQVIKGIHSILLRSSGYPHLVSARVMTEIMKQCQDNIVEGYFGANTKLKMGDKVTPVRINHPFYKFVGTYAGQSESNREQALFTLFGRENLIEFENTHDLQVA